MLTAKGTVVRSLAGHDKGDLLLVVEADEKTALVCDGRQRKLEKPKKKNLKHIEAASYILSEEDFVSNGRLRKALLRLSEATTESGG